MLEVPACLENCLGPVECLNVCSFARKVSNDNQAEFAVCSDKVCSASTSRVQHPPAESPPVVSQQSFHWLASDGTQTVFTGGQHPRKQQSKPNFNFSFVQLLCVFTFLICQDILSINCSIYNFQFTNKLVNLEFCQENTNKLFKL